MRFTWEKRAQFMRFTWEKEHNLRALPGKNCTIYAICLEERAQFMCFIWEKGNNSCALPGKKGKFMRFT